MENIDELLSALGDMGNRENKRKLKERMLAHGYAEADFKTFNTLRKGLPGLVQAGTCVSAIAENTDHKPSAICSLALSKYLRSAAKFMYGILETTGTDPKDFDLQPDLTQFYSALDAIDAEANKVLEKHNLAQSVSETA
jgi:hypothetical protein